MHKKKCIHMHMHMGGGGGGKGRGGGGGGVGGWVEGLGVGGGSVILLFYSSCWFSLINSETVKAVTLLFCSISIQ